MAHASLDTDLSRRFFAPINDIYPETDRQYNCSGISDIHFAQLGTLRALGTATTGQEFLQNHADHDVANIDPGHFFKSLSSARRLANLTSFNDQLAGVMNGKVPDPYAQCSELDGWDLYAVDGHYHRAACFDPKIVDSKGVPKKFATGHFFRMDMRTHHMSCFPLAVPPDGKKKVHDVRAIKRSSAKELRNGASKGRKVMLVWDKACIDSHLWHALKHTYSVYFLSMEKSNSAAEIISTDLLDDTEPRNEGVVSDQFVGTSNGVQLRRIVYINPEDGVKYVYLTNEFNLPAYQLVLLYKHRWDIEKIFNQFKSKLKERKSWGSSPEAKQNQAVFTCLAANLLLLFECQMITEEGLRDEVEVKKKKGRRRPGSQKPGADQAARNFINSAVTRATQRTQRFIRWIAVRIYQKAPWSESLALLRKHWGMPA